MLYENLETIQELAERWRVPLSWLYAKTRQKGENCIPLVRMGKYIRFKPDEVDRWLREQNEACRERTGCSSSL